MEALCLPEQLSSFHQRTLAQMGKPIIVELFGTGRRSIRATGRGDEGQAGNHDLHNVREFNQELPGMEGPGRSENYSELLDASLSPKEASAALSFGYPV